jgi:hypothetical protein
MRDLTFQTNKPGSFALRERIAGFQIRIGEIDGQSPGEQFRKHQAIDLSAWIAGNSIDVLATNFGRPASLFEKFPRKDVFISPNQ